MRCPHCDEIIESEQINLVEGVALCPGCNQLSRLSKLVDSKLSIKEQIQQPPRGCTLEQDFEAVRIVILLRSWGSATGLLFFCLFWNMITSLFVLIALEGLYYNLVGPIPDWFPKIAVEKGVPIMNDAPMGLGATLGLCLFLTPFVLIGLGFAYAVLLNLIGKVVIELHPAGCFVATGISSWRWKKRFQADQVRAIEFNYRKDSDSEEHQIRIDADRTIKFGSTLESDQRMWVYAILKTLLLHPDRARERGLSELTWLKNRARSVNGE